MVRETLSDIQAWQAMLDRHDELFQELVPGSRIGLVARCAAAVVPGQHGSAYASRFDTRDGILFWEAHEDGMRADYRACRDLEEAAVDLLLVADDEALDTIRGALNGEPLVAMKRLIRRGNLLFFVTRTKHELRDAGYEDFLDSLGLAFLGACR